MTVITEKSIFRTSAGPIFYFSRILQCFSPASDKTGSPKDFPIKSYSVQEMAPYAGVGVNVQKSGEPSSDETLSMRCWHVGGIRPTVSLDAALMGNPSSHGMPWPFALLVPCRMHLLVLHGMCSPTRRMCRARLLVIGPG